jgi:hypothetical protein
MKPTKENLAREMRLAKSLCVDLPKSALSTLNALIRRHEVSLADGDVKYLDGRWYVTHTGLLNVAVRRHCVGIDVRPSLKSCDPASSRWVFRATVFRTKTCKGFVGYGDADPSNVSARVRGAEMRMAETRAVNRALRKAYGIGLCSVEEIDSLSNGNGNDTESGRVPPLPSNGNRAENGNGSPRVRDRLCQLIRQHRLDPDLVKAYAIDFCGAKTLKDATRTQVEAFVDHLAEWAAKDRDALLCQLNSYPLVEEKSEDTAGAA